MKERHINNVQARIDALNNVVRYYLAIGEKLKDTTLGSVEKQQFKAQRLELFGEFNKEQKAELAQFGEFMKAQREKPDFHIKFGEEVKE